MKSVTKKLWDVSSSTYDKGDQKSLNQNLTEITPPITGPKLIKKGNRLTFSTANQPRAKQSPDLSAEWECSTNMASPYKALNFGKVFLQNTGMKNRTDLNLGGIIYVSFSLISQILDLFIKWFTF